MSFSGACSAARRPSILVVEDEGLIRMTTAEAFQLAGWQVLEASTGEIGLTLVDQHRPSVVFTDINLGGRVTGWDVGMLGCAYGSRIIFTSGLRSAQALMLPDGVFFPKPYDTAAVIHSCSRAIGHSASERSV